MRVELRRSGGFAAAVIRQPITLDTSRLEPDESDRVCRLVDGVRQCAPAPAESPPGAADLSRYTLTISEDPGIPEGPESLSFSDPVPAPVDALVEVVIELGEVIA